MKDEIQPHDNRCHIILLLRSPLDDQESKVSYKDFTKRRQVYSIGALIVNT